MSCSGLIPCWPVIFSGFFFYLFFPILLGAGFLQQSGLDVLAMGKVFQWPPLGVKLLVHLVHNALANHLVSDRLFGKFLSC